MNDSYIEPTVEWAVPAAAGWIAQVFWLNEDTDTLEVEYMPIVAWADDERYMGGALVWVSGEDSVESLRSWVASSNCTAGNVLFDPTRLPASVEFDEADIRFRIATEQEKH